MTSSAATAEPRPSRSTAFYFLCRAPTSRDAAAATAGATVEAARNTLLSRCAVPAAVVDGPVADAYRSRTQAAIAAEIALLDPQAEHARRTHLSRPAAARGKRVLEVVDFLWAEIRSAGAPLVAGDRRAGARLRLARSRDPRHERRAPRALRADGNGMSDFLTRLAERQLGRIETIEPRIKPLFATDGA